MIISHENIARDVPLGGYFLLQFEWGRDTTYALWRRTKSPVQPSYVLRVHDDADGNVQVDRERPHQSPMWTDTAHAAIMARGQADGVIMAARHLPNAEAWRRFAARQWERLTS